MHGSSPAPDEPRRLWAAAALAWAGKRRELVASLAGIAVLALAFWALSVTLREIRIDDVEGAFATIHAPRWAAALAFTAASFGCLIVFDVAALRTLRLGLSLGVASRAAVTSYAISNTVGLPLLTGGSVRLNFYVREGLTEGDVVRVVALAGLTFWLGIAAVVALTLPLQRGGVSLGGVAVPQALLWAAPVVLAAAVAAYLRWTGRRERGLGKGAARLPLPGPKWTLAQLAAAALDISCAAAVLWVLTPSLGAADFPHLLAVYALALAVAVVSHAPGGLGVFEAMMFLLLPEVPEAELAAALVGYRLVYFLLPFVLALLYIGVREGERLHQHALPIVRLGGSVTRSLAPTVASAAVFSAGALLILTGAVPLFPERVAAITRVLPSSLLDLSHFTSSIIGTLLLFTAYGLFRRRDAAWLASMLLLAAGVLITLLRAFDWVEAAVLAAVFALLAWTRPAFYRQSAIMTEPPGPGWIIAIAGVIAASLFLGFFAYKDVTYSDALWWQVQPGADAPRFLRASVGVALVALIVAGVRLARGKPRLEPQALPPAVWERALAASEAAEAHLARTKDKFFLVSEAGDAFLMYRVRGKSFIAMGQPVGPQERWGELVWRFRELADRYGGRTVFYRCDARMLPHAIDLGLRIMKIGEAARVKLAGFSLDGKQRAKLRHAVSRAEREGLGFRVVEGAALRALLPQLEAVSDEWLAAKKLGEKQFSLGRFDEEYLLGGPVALVERDGAVLAFANLWTLPGRAELSFDLMRSRTELPNGTMDFLFARLMEWARDEGYAHFALGMAPLSGIESRRLAPTWARLANLAFHHGERLYGYSGLRRYKEKFLPEWSGRYFVAPRGPAMARALLDVTLLVSAPPVIGARGGSEGLPLPALLKLGRQG